MPESPAHLSHRPTRARHLLLLSPGQMSPHSLQPDLVLTFSDLQVDIVADLIRRGIDVHAFNQRTITGILDMIGWSGQC